MNWNQKDLICEFELLKEKIDDVLTTHIWHGDDMYRFKDLKNSAAREHYTLGYNESRIQHEHTTELMQVYLQRFDDLIKEFKALDIEKASSEECLATESDNA